jgi:dihydroorotate dehydrogenase
MLYDQILKPLLFLFSPETAHDLAMKALHLTAPIPGFNKRLSGALSTGLEKTVAGIRFPNPLGLAAGFDKDGRHIRQLDSLGFGFIEMGTITPRPQSGNPKPRLFRLPEDRALINRMGFNNQGLDKAVWRLSRLKTRPAVIGANIGKNKTTPNERAEQDYLAAFEALFPWVDYFTVNVSSPNTPGLRALQEKEPLKRLLSALLEANDRMEAAKPIFLKIAPDLNNHQTDDAASLVNELPMAGLIATNTTISREGLRTPQQRLAEIGDGGLSGAPLAETATAMIRRIRQGLSPQKALIGVGGIMSADDALAKIDAGADLIQIYTGFIYRGPALIGEIHRALTHAS